MAKIRAVLFDLGGTLAKPEPTPKIFEKILKAHGISIPIEKIIFAAEKAGEKLDVKRMSELGVNFWINFNLIVLEYLGIKDNAIKLAEAIDREWWEYAEISLYPDAQTVLQKLKERKVKIGVVTNTFQYDLEKVLSKLNLKGFFDVEACIDVAGKAKPEKEIFIYALNKLNLQPDEVLFVGDEFEADYEGALKAGLKALLIDRENKIDKKDIKKIGSLEEILPIIEGDKSSMLNEIAVKIKETVRILKRLGYNCESISPKEFYDYMTGETPTGDTITLEDVLKNEFLLVHEVVEISELKKMNVPINKQTIMNFYPNVYEAHFTALDYELTFALGQGNFEWVKMRLKNFESQLDDPYLPQEFSHLKRKLAPKCELIMKKFSNFLS
ncbi:MAG: HAD family hydrolase [Candidatus Bathyarchaeia archaeon]